MVSRVKEQRLPTTAFVAETLTFALRTSMTAMRIAKKALERSDHAYAHHGVVVFRGGSVVSIGYNHGTTHAEVQALEKLWPSKRRGCKILSIRVTEAGKVTMAKPCANCEAYLRENGVKTVLYTDHTGKVVRMKL